MPCNCWRGCAGHKPAPFSPSHAPPSFRRRAQLFTVPTLRPALNLRLQGITFEDAVNPMKSAPPLPVSENAKALKIAKFRPPQKIVVLTAFYWVLITFCAG